MSFVERARLKLAEIVGGVSMSRNLQAADILYGQVRVPPPRGSWQFLLAYRSSPLLRMLTAKVAESMAAVDWHVTVPGPKGPKVLTDHPLQKLLNGGNEMLTGYQVRKLTTIHYKIVGEAHWLLERNMLGVPVGLMPLVPTWVVTTPRPGRPWYDIAVTEGGFVGRIAASEVITFKDVDPYRPYDRGTGLAMSMDDELQADDAAAKYTAGYLQNNARPDLIVTGNVANGAPGLSKDEMEDLKKAWMDRFQGPQQRGLPLFASGDINVQEIGKTMTEMQFVDLRKFERDFCISVFGIPPEIVSVLTSSNRATAEAAQLMLGRQVLKPMLADMQAVIQERLVPQFDPKITVTFDDPTPDDTQAMQQALTGRPWMASVDEHRAMAGLDPLPNGEGEVYPIPTLISFEPKLAVGGPPESGQKPPPPDQDEGNTDGGNPDSPGKRVRRAARRLKDETPKPKKEDVDAVAEAASAEVVIAASEPVIAEIVRQFGQDAITDIGMEVSFDLTDPNVSSFLQDFGADRITGMINETTQSAIRDAITDTWEAGGTQADIIDAISDVFDTASTSRASTIAATETNRASNFATNAGFDQAGVPGKEWLSTRDDKVRDTHKAMDGQQVAQDADFHSPSGDHGPYPGAFETPEEDCNCRCGIVPVMDFDDSDDSEDASGLGLDTESKRDSWWRHQDRKKQGYERLMTTRLKGAFAKQKASVLHEARRRFA